jgi:hypothetical protein
MKWKSEWNLEGMRGGVIQFSHRHLPGGLRMSEVRNTDVSVNKRTRYLPNISKKPGVVSQHCVWELKLLSCNNKTK